MIHHIKQQIEDKLKELFPEHTIYDEDLPENYQKPSFLVNVISYSVNGGLAGKQKSQIYIDLSYYGASIDGIKSECFHVGLKLIEDFYLESYQIKNKKVENTDNIMHFTFDTQYLTRTLKNETIMEKQQIQINL